MFTQNVAWLSPSKYANNKLMKGLVFVLKFGALYTLFSQNKCTFFAYVSMFLKFFISFVCVCCACACMCECACVCACVCSVCVRATLLVYVAKTETLLNTHAH